ncbi:hypothetical protein OIV83_003707 [Microbotryomycetes sp. JL201]|nr:hypothetical protein OIV83_003707 [Microbotryomycetes sp. JL201]
MSSWSLLPVLLRNSFQTTHPALLVVTDSILQPGLLLVRQFISAANDQQDAIIVLSMEQIKSRLVPKTVDESRLRFIDKVSAWTPSASSSATHVEQAEILAIQQSVTEAVQSAVASTSSKILVVFDSANEIAEYGLDALHSLVRTTLKALQFKSGTQQHHRYVESHSSSAERSYYVAGSRLLVLHHSNSPSGHRNDLSRADVATILASPSLSQSHIHLTLHPSPLIELLSREYGLSITLDDHDGESMDVRCTTFLHSFASRSWGDPFTVPARHGELDERIPLDIGGKEADAQGRCVIEWSTRGINIPSLRKNDSGTKRIVHHGLEGLRRTKAGVEPVNLNSVVDRKQMRLVDISKLSSAASSVPVGPALSSESQKTSGEPLLPFNLSLTDAQHSAREDVALPFTPREDGGMYRGGAITYMAESEDDIDDEDPDEDLEI